MTFNAQILELMVYIGQLRKWLNQCFLLFRYRYLSLSPQSELHFTQVHFILGCVCFYILTHRESLCTLLLLFLNNPSKTKGMKTKWTQVVCSIKIRNPKLLWKLCPCINNKQCALACPNALIIMS